MPKPWVIGTLARQLWAVAGPHQNVNQTLLQPFANYNMPDGWYLVSRADNYRQLERAVRAALERSNRRWRGQNL
jgi:hypothetical protein